MLARLRSLPLVVLWCCLQASTNEQVVADISTVESALKAKLRQTDQLRASHNSMQTPAASTSRWQLHAERQLNSLPDQASCNRNPQRT